MLLDPAGPLVRVGVAGAGLDAWPAGTQVFAGLGRCEVPAGEPARVGAPLGEVERYHRGPLGSRQCEGASVGAEGLARLGASAGSDERVADRLATCDIDEPDRCVKIGGGQQPAVMAEANPDEERLVGEDGRPERSQRVSVAQLQSAVDASGGEE